MSDPIRDDNELAAEYVVGLLDEDTRAEVALRIERDAAFAALVNGWQNRLADFNQAYGDVTPSGRVKQAIDARLFATPGAASAGLFGWLRASWLAGAIVAVLSVVAIWVGLTPQPVQYELTAKLETVEQGFAFEAGYDAETNQLTITPLGGTLPADRALELWAIPEDGVPISLGLLALGDSTSTLPEVAMAAGVTLAVSLEPTGGSPTGAPTGPVLSAGVLEDV